jgi:hypothetical protein
VQAVADRLDGEWLLVGGGAAILWFGRDRETEDVDLVGLRDTMEERLQLLTLAAERNLPVEAVNSAADFFVRRIDGWRDEIAPRVKGARGQVYAPSATLFVLTKLNRLSEEDLGDVEAAMTSARADGLPFDAERVRAALDALAPSEDPAVEQRRRSLRAAL